MADRPVAAAHNRDPVLVVRAVKIDHGQEALIRRPVWATGEISTRSWRTSRSTVMRVEYEYEYEHE
jgi:hypothetical protein